jgi:RNA recognition motif-containing protein
VKGLSFQAYESDIQELFNTFGNVLTVRLLTREDGKSRGLAFVKFSKKSSFNKALELNGSEQFGRPITVEESLGKKNNDGGFNKGGDFGNKGGYNKFQAPQTPANIETPTLFIGGLSYNSTKESIADFFSHVGPIMNARVVTDK